LRIVIGLLSISIHQEMIEEGENVSYQQVARTIARNFVVEIPPRRIQISEVNKKKRVKWIEDHQRWRKWKWDG